MWQFVGVAQGTNEVASPVATSTLTRDAGAPGTWTRGACSTQTLAADGFVEFTVNVTGKYRALGFTKPSQFQTPSTNFNTIERGIYLKGGGTPTEFAIVELGTERTTGVYAANDVFRVQRVGGVVTYYKNGDLVYTSVVLGPLNGAAMIDSAYFDADAVMQNVRLYDDTKKSWPALTWLVVSVTASAGTAHVPRRFRFLTPSTVKPGDSLLVLLAAQGQEFVISNSAAWESPLSAITATLKRGFVAQRRIAEPGEPRQYFVNVACRHESIGVLLAYRGASDPNALSNAAAQDHVATVDGFTPLIDKTRALDLVVGCSLLYNPQGNTIDRISGATQRAQFQTTVFATPARLTAFEMATRNAGKTGAGTHASGLPGGASFGTFSFLMSGRPSPSARALPSDSPGAIGLQAVGI